MDRALFQESLSLLSPSFGLPRGIVPPSSIAPPDVSAPGYASLWRSALLPNSPRLLPAQLTAAWDSRRRWVTPGGKPDLVALRREFGDVPVPVANCSEREHNSNPKTQMPMREFLSYWQGAMSRDGCPSAPYWQGAMSQDGCPSTPYWQGAISRDGCPSTPYWQGARSQDGCPSAPYWQGAMSQDGCPSTPYWQGAMSQDGCPSALPRLYLKDWHMPKEFPEHDAYSTPECFSSDWLNEYCDAAGSDDYRFVYMGPRGSWTPFHSDVFRSYSWSANVCGRKFWLLYPPGREEALRDRLGNLPFDVTAETAGGESGASLRTRRDPEPIEVIQEAGEIIFVPSGWHHQVHNLEDTISINHNWLNGCNIDLVWTFLQSELLAVQREIGHCRSGMSNWSEQCQCIMKACTGIDYGGFYAFMKLIAERRVELLDERGDVPVVRRADRINSTDPGHSGLGELAQLGDWQAAFDLVRVQEVLVAMQGDPDFGLLPVDCLPIRPEQLRMDIEQALGNVGRN